MTTRHDMTPVVLYLASERFRAAHGRDPDPENETDCEAFAGLAAGAWVEATKAALPALVEEDFLATLSPQAQEAWRAGRRAQAREGDDG